MAAERNEDAIEAARKAWDAQQEYFVATAPAVSTNGVAAHAGATFSGIGRVGWDLVSTAVDGGFLIATFRRFG